MAKTAKNILALNHEGAMDFFMKSEQYHGFKLPEYFTFDEVLKYVREVCNEENWAIVKGLFDKFNVPHITSCAIGKQNLYPKFNDILRKASMYPFHSTIFNNGGASNLIREFICFSATIISPVVKMHPEVIGPSLQGEYQKAKTDFEFTTVSPEEIFKKVSFISSIIGSILDDF